MCDICVGVSVPLKSSPSFVRYFSRSCPQFLWPETMQPLKTTFSSDRLVLDGDQPSMFSRRQQPIQSLFRSTFLEVQVDVERFYQPFHRFQWPDELPPDCGETLSLLTPQGPSGRSFQSLSVRASWACAPCSPQIFSFLFRADFEVHVI